MLWFSELNFQESVTDNFQVSKGSCFMPKKREKNKKIKWQKQNIRNFMVCTLHSM